LGADRPYGLNKIAFHLMIQTLVTMLIVYILLNLTRRAQHIQLDMLYVLTNT